MAYRNPFNPRGTDYRGAQESMDRAQRELTSALDAKGKADKQARIKKSGERSGMQKLLSAAGRAGLAYATGGTSEALGFGGVVDDVMLGTDSEGNRIRNEYGDLVEAGTKVYGAMDARKASDIAGKRASNIRDFKEQVDLAEKMGVLDKKQGRDMMLDAMDLRSRQQAQTKAADEKGVWGWNNEFDDLALSPAQIRGREIAQEKQLADKAKQEGILDSEGRRQGDQLAGYNALKAEQIKEKALSGREGAESDYRDASPIRQAGTADRHPDIKTPSQKVPSIIRERQDAIMRDRINEKFPEHQAELDRIEALYRKDRIGSISDSGPSPFNTTESESLKYRADVDDMMDGELSKKRGTELWGEGSGKTRQEIVADWLGGGQKGSDGKYAPSWITNRIQDDAKAAGYPVGKTFSEKEAEKLSRKDKDESPSAMDEIAVKNRVKELKKQGFIDRIFNRDDDDKQLLLEDRLEKEEATRKFNERTGGPYGRKDYKGSLYDPYRNPSRHRELKRAREIALKKGGILAQ